MAKAHEVLQMLLPDAEYVIRGESYSDIEFIKGATITEQEFLDGFAEYDSLKAYEDNLKAEAKAGLLARLGITAEEAELLLS